jgi:hypothetical protein
MENKKKWGHRFSTFGKISGKGSLTLLLCLVFLAGCSTDDSDPIKTLGEINAEIIDEILTENQIKWVEIYENNTVTGQWVLAASNQEWSGAEEICYVQGIYFYLNGHSSKTYYAPNIPTHQISGYYYFNLHYLVSFEIGLNKEYLYLYFKY